MSTPYFSNPPSSAAEDAHQRVDRALEFDDLGEQRVDAFGHRRVAAEQLVLDLVDVVLQAGDHRRIFVDHLVENRVQDRLRAHAQQFRGALQPVPDQAEIR